MTRLPIVGVMGSGRSAHPRRASALGRWLASRGEIPYLPQTVPAHPDLDRIQAFVERELAA